MWSDIDRSLARFEVPQEAHAVCGAMEQAAFTFRRDGATIAQQMAAATTQSLFSSELFDHVMKELERLPTPTARVRDSAPPWLQTMESAEDGLLLDCVYTYAFCDPVPEVLREALFRILESRYASYGYNVDASQLQAGLDALRSGATPTFPPGFREALVLDYAGPGWMRAW
jgi:hypothetical protein